MLGPSSTFIRTKSDHSELFFRKCYFAEAGHDNNQLCVTYRREHPLNVCETLQLKHCYPNSLQIVLTVDD